MSSVIRQIADFLEGTVCLRSKDTVEAYSRAIASCFFAQNVSSLSKEKIATVLSSVGVEGQLISSCQVMRGHAKAIVNAAMQQVAKNEPPDPASFSEVLSQTLESQTSLACHICSGVLCLPRNSACGHIFCTSCFCDWMMQPCASGEKGSLTEGGWHPPLCPLCRRPMFAKEAQKDAALPDDDEAVPRKKTRGEEPAGGEQKGERWVIPGVNWEVVRQIPPTAHAAALKGMREVWNSRRSLGRLQLFGMLPPHTSDLADEIKRTDSVGGFKSSLLAEAFFKYPRTLFVPPTFRAAPYSSLAFEAQCVNYLLLENEEAVDKTLLSSFFTQCPTALESGVNVLPEIESTATSPIVVASLLNTLDVQPGMRVLDVGSGTGQTAAILAHIVGAKEGGVVDSIEVSSKVLHYAARNVEDCKDTHPWKIVGPVFVGQIFEGTCEPFSSFNFIVDKFDGHNIEGRIAAGMIDSDVFDAGHAMLCHIQSRFVCSIFQDLVSDENNAMKSSIIDDFVQRKDKRLIQSRRICAVRGRLLEDGSIQLAEHGLLHHLLGFSEGYAMFDFGKNFEADLKESIQGRFCYKLNLPNGGGEVLCEGETVTAISSLVATIETAPQESPSNRLRCINFLETSIFDFEESQISGKKYDRIYCDGGMPSERSANIIAIKYLAPGGKMVYSIASSHWSENSDGEKPGGLFLTEYTARGKKMISWKKFSEVEISREYVTDICTCSGCLAQRISSPIKWGSISQMGVSQQCQHPGFTRCCGVQVVEPETVGIKDYTANWMGTQFVSIDSESLFYEASQVFGVQRNTKHCCRDRYFSNEPLISLECPKCNRPVGFETDLKGVRIAILSAAGVTFGEKWQVSVSDSHFTCSECPDNILSHLDLRYPRFPTYKFGSFLGQPKQQGQLVEADKFFDLCPGSYTQEPVAARAMCCALFETIDGDEEHWEYLQIHIVKCKKCEQEVGFRYVLSLEPSQGCEHFVIAPASMLLLLHQRFGLFVDKVKSEGRAVDCMMKALFSFIGQYSLTECSSIVKQRTISAPHVSSLDFWALMRLIPDFMSYGPALMLGGCFTSDSDPWWGSDDLPPLPGLDESEQEEEEDARPEEIEEGSE